VEERQEGGVRLPPQFSIQRRCALTYMNASSGRNLSRAVKRRGNATLVAAESCGALHNCQRHALFVRTNATSVLGVSDPSRIGRGAKKGAAKWGSLTPTASDGGRAAAVAAPWGGTERRH
jgi:hypothetical protein